MIDPPGYFEKDPPPMARNHGVPWIPEGKVGGVKTTFAEQAYRPKYVFQGLNPYVDRAAERENYPDHSLRSRIHNDWFLAQISNSLGNACSQHRREAAQASLDRAVALRDIWSIALKAIDEAIIDAARELNLSEPPFARKPEVNHGPRRIRRPEHPGE